jgi:hypothetical protein
VPATFIRVSEIDRSALPQNARKSGRKLLLFTKRATVFFICHVEFSPGKTDDCSG